MTVTSIATILMTIFIAVPKAFSDARPDLSLSATLSEEHKTIHGHILAMVHYSPPDRTMIVLEEQDKEGLIHHYVLLVAYSPHFWPNDNVVATGIERSLRRESYNQLRGQRFTPGSQLSSDEESLLQEYVDVINGHQVLANNISPGSYPFRRISDTFSVLDYMKVTNIRPSN